MSSKAHWELLVLGSALAMGVLADVLLRALPWGLNLCIWMTAFAAVVVMHVGARTESNAGAAGGIPAPAKPEALSVTGRWLPAAAALFALSFVWRDAPQLNLLSLLAIFTVLSWVMLEVQAGGIRRAGFVEYALGAAVAGLNAAFGVLPVLFGDVEWRKLARGRASRQALAVARGALFALPCLLIFGGLFMAADAVFDHIVRQTFHIDLQKLLTHFFMVGFFAWLAGGYLRGILWGKEASLLKGRPLPAVSLGTTEGAVLLGALDLLFLAFILVQVRTFFGGSTLVQATTGLTYAEYARRGFFQLVGVAALLLPLLLLVHWLMAQRGAPGERVFRLLAGLQILLLFVVMASALQRMRLYQAEYGLTQQRLYATAFMGWLAVVFLWFAVSVLSGRRRRFAFGTALAGFALIVVLHFLNPDALVARVNLERAKAGRSFDARYVTRLSADAVPELVAALPDLNPQDRCSVSGALLRRWGGEKPPDWRTWNWSNGTATRIVRERESSLKAARCVEQPEPLH